MKSISFEEFKQTKAKVLTGTEVTKVEGTDFTFIVVPYKIYSNYRLGSLLLAETASVQRFNKWLDKLPTIVELPVTVKGAYVSVIVNEHVYNSREEGGLMK